MAVLVASLTAASVLHRSAQCQEPYVTAYPVWLGPVEATESVALGDVDGDGDLDLVCGNSSGNTMYLNVGGSFDIAPSWARGVSEATLSVALGDVNGDGTLDLVCGNRLRNDALYLNSGGTFQTAPAWSSASAEWTVSVALGDVDGDGDLDLLCGNNRNVALYLNTGGTFAPSPSSTLPSGVQSLALGDVDGDGDLDLVCGDAGSGRLYLNAGGAFPSTPAWTSGLRHDTRSVALGDLDGDGDLDLVCGNYGEAATLYFNTGGTFEDLPSWSSTPTSATRGVALGDLDGDGDLDLVCANYGQSNTLYLNTGATLAATPSWSSVPTQYTRSVALGDVDGDGDLDLAFGNYNESNALYLDASGAFEPMPAWSSDPSQNTQSVALGDVDGDGDLDLVCGNIDLSNVLYLNSGGTFEPTPAWSSEPTLDTRSVALGDVDGDGDLDLVCGNLDQSNSLYLNTGTTFEPAPSWSSEETEKTSSVTLGDVDGDGDLDLVCGNIGQSSALYLNAGGTFVRSSWSPPSSIPLTTTDVALGDVDGDGDLDLVCGMSRGSTLYFNTGATFDSVPAWTAQSERTYGVALGDVDGDGDLDLVCGNLGRNTLYLNTGGTFALVPSWSSGPTEDTHGVALGDVDGDGDLDLVCASYEGGALYRNIGGTFESVPSWSSMQPPVMSSAALGDVDGDGDLDVVCGQTSDSNALYMGKAAPVFKANPLLPERHLPNNGAILRLVTAEKTSPEYYRVRFTAVDVESDPIWLVAEYHHEGDSSWHPAVAEGEGGRRGPFATSPAGVADSITWDTHLLPFDPRDVTLRLRVVEIPRRVSIIQQVSPYLKKVGRVTPYRPLLSTVAQLSFPPVALGDTTSAGLPLTNKGNVTLTVDGVAFTTPDLHTEGAFPLQIAPQNTVVLAIRLAPSTDGEVQANLVIQNDDPFSPSTDVALSALVRPLDFTLANLYPAGVIPQGTPLGVSITMRDSVRTDSALVFFRQGGEAAFDSLMLQRIDDPVNEQYYGLIPADAIGARGIEYVVQVHNDRFMRSSANRRLRTRVLNIPFASTPPANRYGMISFPLETESPILGVLSDDLGGQNNTAWRLWEYDNVAASYVEVPNDSISHFETSRGYWLITRQDHPIDTGPAEGLSIPVDGPFEIRLEPGWSMIGNPFDFPVAWGAIRVGTLSMAEAEAQGVIEPPWRWAPASGRYEQDAPVLEPFAGYWVMNRTDPPSAIVLGVPPVEFVGGGVPATSVPLAGHPPGGETRSDSWGITIAVTCGDVTTRCNRIGVRSEALDVYDPLDRSAPPMSPGESVALYFPHPSWDRHAGHYAVDIRAPGAKGGDTTAASARAPGAGDVDGHEWFFDVAKSFERESSGDEIVLEFSGVETLPDGATVMLVDRKLDHVVDLRKEPRYAFYQGRRERVTREEASRFLVLTGDDSFLASHGEELPALPGRSVLLQNYRNPFKSSTIIRFETARAGRVKLLVYDVGGALVRVLEDRDREPGRYEIGWNGENDRGERISSGMYFCVLETPSGRIAKKMLCVK